MKWRMDRYMPVNLPVVDLGAILGGFEVTILMVSRMAARERRIDSPETVVSQ
jgi:hypothetical protein